jgi:hypothetical protein
MANSNISDIPGDNLSTHPKHNQTDKTHALRTIGKVLIVNRTSKKVEED